MKIKQQEKKTKKCVHSQAVKSGSHPKGPVSSPSRRNNTRPKSCSCSCFCFCFSCSLFSRGRMLRWAHFPWGACVCVCVCLCTVNKTKRRVCCRVFAVSPMSSSFCSALFCSVLFCFVLSLLTFVPCPRCVRATMGTMLRHLSQGMLI
jgi:hypothetical protein